MPHQAITPRHQSRTITTGWTSDNVMLCQKKRLLRHMNQGFHLLMVSFHHRSSFLCVSIIVQKQFEKHHSHYDVITHPLCNIPLDVDFLFKWVCNLMNKIQANYRQPATRSTVDDSRAGKDIYQHSMYSKASDFVCLPRDDIELVDFVFAC